jgi:quercetin dioxygenase-like cupin family protein
MSNDELGKQDATQAGRAAKASRAGRKPEPKIGANLGKYLFLESRSKREVEESVPDYSRYVSDNSAWLDKPNEPAPDPENLMKLLADRREPGCDKADTEHPLNNFRSITSTAPRMPDKPTALEANFGEFVKPSKEPGQRWMHRNLGEELVYVLSGSARFLYYDGRETTLHPGDAIWLRGEMYHEFFSLSEEPARVLVTWWSPEFCESKLEGTTGGRNVELFKRRPEQHSSPTVAVPSAMASSNEEDRTKYVKFCHGIPELILYRLKLIGRDETTLLNWLNREDRSIKEMLHGSFDISEEAIKKIAKQLPCTPKDLIWRFDDMCEPWFHVFREKKVDQWTTPDHAVIRIRRLPLGTKDHKREIEPVSDTLFIPLSDHDGMIRVDTPKMREQRTELKASCGEALFVSKMVSKFHVFPNYQAASCLTISCHPDRAEKLYTPFKKDAK